MGARVKQLLRLGAAHLKEALGAEQKYCIRGAYQHRSAYTYNDDTGLTDEWQREVYQRASKIAFDEGLTTIGDVGCGSGFKLIRYLGQFATTGFDVPETVEFLKKKYPDRTWTTQELSDTSDQQFDLVISADVIEHVLDPDRLLRFIVAKAKSWIVLSTPDRDLIWSRLSPHRLGPPYNPCHVREWSFQEFGRFVAQYLDIVEHSISNSNQGTQMVVGRVH